METNLERVSAGLNQITERVDTLTDRMDKFEVTLEVLNHTWNERFNKLWENQTIIMEAQNQSWQAIGTLDPDSRKLNSESRQTHRHGGYASQGTVSTERQRIEDKKGIHWSCTPLAC